MALGAARLLIILLGLGVQVPTELPAAEAAPIVPPEGQPVHQVLAKKPADLMLHYFEGLARALPPARMPAASAAEWEERRGAIRRRLLDSMGDFPHSPRPPLNAKTVGTIEGDGYVIEKVLYESLPGLYVTALLYRPPSITGQIPAVVCLNGHWPEAKFTDHIQLRCQALAKQGLIAFCQDVIGTGERAAPADAPHPTYHGNYRGGVAQIVGRSLFGYELYEARRAVDYLGERPDVDARRIICTGASGGGMQSLFLPAIDDRLAGSVPVCYVGSYQAHMGATACVGEIPRGILSYTNQWELLGMHAPRPVLCIAASRDVAWFQPVHAEEAARRARAEVYRLYGRDDAISVATVDAPHAYNQEMRELMYNFVAAHLQGEAAPRVTEPAGLAARSPDELRVGLPAKSETVQSLTYARACEMVAAFTPPRDRDEHLEQARRIRSRVVSLLALDAVEPHPARFEKVRAFAWNGGTLEHWTLEPEPCIVLPAAFWLPKAGERSSARRAVIVVDEAGMQNSFERGLVPQLVKSGRPVLAIDLRGTGETANTVPAYDYEGLGMDDYNLANYGLIVGRPFLGMQVADIRCALEFLATRPGVDVRQIGLIGRGRAAFAGLLAAVVDDRIAAVACEDMLASYLSPEEFRRIGLSYFIPRILEAGDLEHLAAAVAPRQLLVLNPVDAQRDPLSEQELPASFSRARHAYGVAIGREQTRFLVERIAADRAPRRLASWASGISRPKPQPTE